MTLLRTGIAVFCLFHVFSVLASPALDARYTLRRTVGIVVDAPQQPVYGTQMELELSRLARADSRFDWSDEGFLKAREWVKKTPPAQRPEAAGIEPWRDLLAELARGGAQSAVIAWIQPGEDGCRVALWLVAIGSGNPEIVARAQADAGARPALLDIAAAVKKDWDDLLRTVPFEATILRREGYRVVLDRGKPTFHEGMRLSAYTLEHEDGIPNGPLQLVETGLIQLTQVESDFAFGRIVVEWKPREVTAQNKIRLASAAAFAGEKGPLFPFFDIPLIDSPRYPSGTNSATVVGAPPPPVVAGQPAYGSLTIDLSGSSISMNHTSSQGSQYSSNSFFPGAALRFEGWLTRVFFGDISYGFGIGDWETLASRLNGSYNQLRIQGGYRWNMLGTELGPSLRARIGYSSTHFGVDPSPDSSAPSAAGYHGILIGGDFVFPFTARFGLGLQGNALLFPSLAEDHGTSGAQVTGVSAWDFALAAYYQWDAVFCIDARFEFETLQASFSGVGTAANSLAAMSTGGNSLLLGLTYRF
jgi:hypothetical protein